MKLSVPKWAPSRVSDRLDAAIEATRAETIETTRKIEGNLFATTNQMAGYVQAKLDLMEEDVAEVAHEWKIAAICVGTAAVWVGLYFAVKTVKELW